MFAKTIIDSDAFIDMPLSTQALYFHLSMRADDEGFINNPRKIMRMIGASDDDLKVLIGKRFIIPFESGIVVIKHWKIHNYIRGDRKKDTNYVEEMALLAEKENGTYTLKAEEVLLEESTAETLRQKAYRESDLPYSFAYKIRQAFYGEICPICGFKMESTVDECGIYSDIRKPSIQHNIPISKGGKHELGNISVICHNCNISLQDTETGKLNADEVIKKWDEICMSDKCQTSDRQVTDKCQHRLGKVRLGKDSINNICSAPQNNKPVRHKYGEYKNVLLSDEDMDKLKKEFPADWEERIERLSEYIASTGKSYKSHLATIRAWARKEKGKGAVNNEVNARTDADDKFKGWQPQGLNI
jgi:hypothetical protein